MRRFAPALLALFAACRAPEPDVLLELPDFKMSVVGEKTAAPFGRAELLGRVWIADFIFTNCGGPCPLLSDRLSKLGRQLPKEIGLLSISVDPDNDTPAKLREYAAAFGAEYGRWLFLRGPMEETYRLLYAGFRQPMSVDPKAPAAARVTHSTRFVLIDRRARIRGFYDGLSDGDNAAVARDARRLLEARP
ncbi:MAG: SCO family protein [Elusimicrobia bacterium]|nr:SCO family protein [Elusimicrobiota bacterium]